MYNLSSSAFYRIVPTLSLPPNPHRNRFQSNTKPILDTARDSLQPSYWGLLAVVTENWYLSVATFPAAAAAAAACAERPPGVQHPLYSTPPTQGPSPPGPPAVTKQPSAQQCRLRVHKTTFPAARNRAAAPCKNHQTKGLPLSTNPSCFSACLIPKPCSHFFSPGVPFSARAQCVSAALAVHPLALNNIGQGLL